MVFSSNNDKFKLKSKYFNYHSVPKEQNIVNSLIKEAIHVNGIDMIYIPRKYVNLDVIYGEDVLSAFEKTFHMVFYVESSESYQGNNSFLSGIGLDIQDQSKLILSRDIFNDTVVNSPDNNFGIKKPRNGDLLYNSVMNRIFEIVNVEEYQMFYQLGKQYTYTITIEFFDFSHEKIDTKLPEIDNKNDSFISTKFEIKLDDISAPIYEIDETVYIGTNLALATFVGQVSSIDTETNKIIVIGSFGNLLVGSDLKGEDSLAENEIVSFIEIKFNETLKDNEEIQEQSSDITKVDPEDDFYKY